MVKLSKQHVYKSVSLMLYFNRITFPLIFVLTCISISKEKNHSHSGSTHPRIKIPGIFDQLQYMTGVNSCLCSTELSLLFCSARQCPSQDLFLPPDVCLLNKLSSEQFKECDLSVAWMKPVGSRLFRPGSSLDGCPSAKFPAVFQTETIVDTTS